MVIDVRAGGKSANSAPKHTPLEILVPHCSEARILEGMHREEPQGLVGDARVMMLWL